MDISKIKLGQIEHYDATTENCWSFQKTNDIVNGIVMALSNMSGKFPFSACGRNWKNSEEFYLCGEFTNIDAQNDIISMTSGYASKRFGKAKHLSEVREDFPTYRLEWMKFCVWTKAKNNKDFAELLLSTPDDSILIENTTTDNGGSANIWGCSNTDIKKYRQNIINDIEKNFVGTKKAKNEKINIEINKVNDVGVWVGQNNMGKILMLVRDALRNNYELEIDYDLLNKSKIVLFDRIIDFNKI